MLKAGVMKDYEFVNLYDIYGSLLTEHQRTLVEGYYLYDLSFSELAEISGGTRQSVYDAVKKARAILVEHENKLGIVKMRAKLNEFGSDLLSIDKELYDKFQAILQPDNSAD